MGKAPHKAHLMQLNDHTETDKNQNSTKHSEVGNIKGKKKKKNITCKHCMFRGIKIMLKKKKHNILSILTNIFIMKSVRQWNSSQQ